MNDFKIIEDLFLAAVEVPAAERMAFLQRSCAGNPGLREDVESLLSFDTDLSRPLSPILEAGVSGMLDGVRMVGLRIGHYKIEAVLGHGGMGSVYLATRADKQFSRKVAVKFIRRDMDSPGAVGRFLRERQILANLDHPYIGKLLDGGTHEGIPYFVMEYVQGTPIDVYCDLNNLTIEARCELFGRICDAVSYAHRNLVIHRDLKPSNILVKADGTPVLLDFGIAKLLDDAAAIDCTRTVGTWMMTPDYASPEQLRGLSTNTATDVYSLGVVLYQLLTGFKPFSVASTSPLEMARTICDDPPPRPSSVVGKRRLSGDLDNIILMALRKEPERRYHSVDQFREDVQRYLEGHPVIARDDTFGYRAGKFVQRHRTGVLAATLTAALLMGAVVATSYEAHRATLALHVAEAQRNRAEREHETANRQRELATLSEKRAVERANEADAERRKAKKRLAGIIELSHTSLFDVQGTLERLPGALEARRDVILTTRSYLDGLAAEKEDDPAVLAMLITGYTQTGDVLGLPTRSNLGDGKGAMEAWRKAREILTRLKRVQPEGMRPQLQDLGLHQRMGILLESQGELKQALAEYQTALPIAMKLGRAYPGNPTAVVQTGIIEHNLGGTLGRLGDPTASEHVRAEVRIYEQVVGMAPDILENRLGLAAAIGALGQSLVARHRLTEGLEQFRRSLAIREAVRTKAPNDGPGNSGIASNYLRIAVILGAPWQENLGDRSQAVESCGKALAIYEPLSVADPGNKKARADLARALVYMGVLAEDVPKLRRAIAILNELRSEDPKQVTYRTDLALANQNLQVFEAKAAKR